MEIRAENLEVLIVAILVLWLGQVLTRRIHFLDRYNIPLAVTGGIICSLVVALVASVWDVKIVFDLQLRDLFLLFFFSTIGLKAKFNTLVEGGKTLAAFKPTLYCEIDRNFCAWNNIDVSEIFTLLAGHGYRAYLPYDDNFLYNVPGFDSEAVKAEFFFIHRDRAPSYRKIIAGA